MVLRKTYATTLVGNKAQKRGKLPGAGLAIDTPAKVDPPERGRNSIEKTAGNQRVVANSGYVCRTLVAFLMRPSRPKHWRR